MIGSIMADQDTSFQAMDKILLQMINIVAADPAVDTVNGFTGGGGTAAAPSTRHACSSRSSRWPSARSPPTDVIARLRPKLARVPGATLYLQASRTCAWAAASAPRSISSPCAATTCRT